MSPGASWGRWQAGVCVGTRRAVCIGSHSGVRTKQGGVFVPLSGARTRRPVLFARSRKNPIADRPPDSRAHARLRRPQEAPGDITRS